MVYDYYCVNCGNKMHAGEIKFDLAELIGLRDPSKTTADKISLVSPNVLLANIERSGGKLVHKQPCKVEFPLNIYLGILGQNSDRPNVDMQKIMMYSYDELEEAVGLIFSSNENREAAQQKINEYVAELESHFLYKGPKGENERQGRHKTSNYYATFILYPEFFDDGKSKELYTLRYSYNIAEPNPRSIQAPEEIRGYCPKCGKPVLMHAGKYPHVLIGLLGAQSAGKTTLIMSMLEEMKHSYDAIGINYPDNVLCDSRRDDVRKNMELYRKGWAMFKTSAQGENAFNASLLLESAKSHRRMIVTFADIAGEQCYDVDSDNMNLDALQKFPLINSCDAYILCSCLDQTEYGNGNESLDLPPDAVMKIARGIYSHLHDSRKVPPLCIFLTKADVAKSAAAQAAGNNPLAALRVSPLYNYKKLLDNLVTTYSAVGNEDIREPLRWCGRVFQEMQQYTYISMMSGSALGRGASPCPTPEAVEMCPDGKFSRLRIDELLKWIFQTVGLVPVDEKGYCFRVVPSYSERYTRKGEQINRDFFSVPEAGPRSEGIQHVFMNRTPLDREINDIIHGKVEEPRGFFFRNANPTTVESVIEAKDAYLG